MEVLRSGFLGLRRVFGASYKHQEQSTPDQTQKFESIIGRYH